MTQFDAHGFRLVPLHLLLKAGRWRTQAMRSYSQPTLYWVSRGQGRFTIQGVSRGYGAHNIIMLPAGTMHCFDTSGTVTGALLFLPNKPELALIDEPLHLRLRDTQSQAEFAQLLEALQREMERGETAMERALLHQAGLISVWLERHASEKDLEGGAISGRASDRLTAAYTSLLERDFRSGKTVADYAAELGVTPTHLSRCCNTSSGRPASALLHDRLHYEARRLLRETKTPIKDVAAALGFRSAAYFTRAFQNHTGQTPSDFRRRR